ncbi:MAG TPA: DUF1444 family protein [Candidatus Limnocylindrales bacterium]|nr:DUF1444 family protein [Candidatus Limnocylindrales bacterium]
MEREPQGGSDYGADHRRDLGDEPAAAIRDSPPDLLAPIDESAPVSGHTPAPIAESRPSIADSPEHDWSAASKIIYPALRPVGTQGLHVTEISEATLSSDASRSHSQPLVDEGPCGIAVVYALGVGAYDVIVNGDHLLSWGVKAADLQDTALANLAAWSASAAWTDEVSGERRLLSSDTGDGWDAARILLPDVLDRLGRELGATGRVLVGVPERHLLIAGTLRPGDEEFAGLFGEFVVEQSGGADEPIDRRVFELVDGRLVEFSGAPASA